MQKWQDPDKSSKATKIIGTIIGLIAIPLLISLGMRSEEKKAQEYPWSATFYYPLNTISDSKRSEFKTVEECREWVIKKADTLNIQKEEYDYECGRDCTYTDQSIEGGKRVNTYECQEITK